MTTHNGLASSCARPGAGMSSSENYKSGCNDEGIAGCAFPLSILQFAIPNLQSRRRGDFEIARAPGFSFLSLYRPLSPALLSRASDHPMALPKVQRRHSRLAMKCPAKIPLGVEAG